MEEFDLRLDEGMVRWAQGLADRVMWTLVADRRADEMDSWPLPDEAFSYPQVTAFSACNRLELQNGMISIVNGASRRLDRV